MNNKLYVVLSVFVIIVLSLMVGMGLVQARDTLRKYGSSYEVITITNGDETRTTMNVWVNVAFLGFLTLTVYLLALPMIERIELIKTRRDKEIEV